MTYGVWCKVWGGVTGHREGWFRQDGVKQEFPSAESAEEVAQTLMRNIADDPYRKAEYSYTVRKMP